MTVESPSTTQCFHCGEDCEEEIRSDDKVFCCHGCKTVFEIITDSGLTNYYELNKNPGIKAQDKRFKYLDNPEIASGLINYTDDEVTKVTLNLPSIHCSSCIWLLENLSKLLPGITSCQVNFTKKEASILYNNDSLKLSKLADFLAGIGYTPDINIADSRKEKKSSQHRKLRIKIAIAGFCFGNSMLISLPEYLDSSFSEEPYFQTVFGIMNILFAIPVVFYSGWDYFDAAIKGLRKKFISMDLPIALGISTLLIRSVYEIVSSTGPGYIDSLTGLVFFLIIGKWYQSKTYKAFSFDRDYRSFFPIAVLKIENGNEDHVPLQSIKVRDFIQIHPEEIIPADGIIKEGKGEIDYSFVTGESNINSRSAGDRVFAGGRQKGETIILEVVKTVETSYLTSLWNNSTRKGSKTLVELAANKMGKYFTIGIILVALSTGITWSFIDPASIWTVVSSILIVACPCALALAAPFAFGQGLRIFGNNDFYLRDASVIEQLAKCREIVFDKTGTLTSESQTEVVFSKELSNHQKSLIYSLTKQSLHPISKAISNHYKNCEVVGIEAYSEEEGKGIRAKVNGNLVKIGSSEFIKDMPDNHHTGLQIDDKYMGYFDIQNRYRKGLFKLLKDLRQKFKLHLLSGDGDGTLTTLQPYFSQLSYRQKPHDKLEYIRDLQQTNSTLMVGDGLNDAGALKEAQTGIAVIDDLHRFSPASDGIMKGSRLKDLDKFLDLSRTSLKVVYAAFTLSLLYNIVGLSFAVTGNLTPVISAILMPISSVSVVAFVTLTLQYIGRRL